MVLLEHVALQEGSSGRSTYSDSFSSQALRRERAEIMSGGSNARAKVGAGAFNLHRRRSHRHFHRHCDRDQELISIAIPDLVRDLIPSDVGVERRKQGFDRRSTLNEFGFYT